MLSIDKQNPLQNNAYLWLETKPAIFVNYVAALHGAIFFWLDNFRSIPDNFSVLFFIEYGKFLSSSIRLFTRISKTLLTLSLVSLASFPEAFRRVLTISTAPEGRLQAMCRGSCSSGWKPNRGTNINIVHRRQNIHDITKICAVLWLVVAWPILNFRA